MPHNDASRRLPPPWSVKALDECFVVEAADGSRLAYVYFDVKPIVGTGAKLDRDTARRVAANIAKLPELLKKG